MTTTQTVSEVETTAASATASIFLKAGEDRLKRTLYVGGLDAQVQRETLHAAFVPFGDLRTVEIPIDRQTGQHRGFGFVEFEEEDDADAAVDNMHNSELYGRVLTVNLARAPPRNPGEGGKAVWNDDFYYRKRLAEHDMPVADSELDALMSIEEAGQVAKGNQAEVVEKEGEGLGAGESNEESMGHEVDKE